MTDAGKKKVFLLLLIVFMPLFSLFSQNLGSSGSVAPAAGEKRQGDNLTVKLAVMGPGDELYFWFGHIGLVIENKATGQVRFFDWGVFSFDSENFFVNFAFGRLRYCCAVSRAQSYYSAYISSNRDITLYTLNLPAEKKEAILRFAENNVLPENRDYWYHNFRDNCSTRIRDILDMALDGQFSAEFADAPGRYTYRQHVRRHTWAHPFFDWILNFWMGPNIDRPITVWEEMFLPSELAMRAVNFSYTGPDGRPRPLVSSVEHLYKAVGRPAVLDVPRLQWPRELAFSLLVSAALLLLYRFRGSLKGFRIIMGSLHTLLGFFFGVVGSLLFFMTFFTNHDYTFHNANIVFVNPLLLAAVPLGLIFAFTRKDRKRLIAASLLRILWSYVLLGGILTMVIKLFPAFYQQNQVDQALILPLALTMAFIMARLNRSRI